MPHDLNLLPPHRVRALRARARVRAWLLACVGYALALGCVWMWVHVSAPSPASGADRLIEIEANLAAVERDLRDLQRSSTEVVERLATSNAVEGHPDWSLLLELIARSKREEVAIERITLTTRGGAVTRPTDRAILRRGPWTLTLAGLGASQRAVSDFALRLEDSGVFASVAIVEIRARGVSGTGTGGSVGAGAAAGDRPALVEFSLTCALIDGVPTEGRR